MKAIRIHEDGGPEVLRYEDAPDPEPAPGEVLVELRAASLNHLDLWIRKGLPSVPKPRILGADGAGLVDGKRVVINPGIEHGDKITVVGEHMDGTHAELIAVPETNVYPIPDEMSFEEAAAFPLVFETAYRMLVTRASLREGEWVLVWGVGGGLASAANVIAKALGARTIVTSSSDDKLERVEADSRSTTDREDVVEAVKEATGGRGADVVVESVGEATWQRTLQAAAQGGRITVCGATSGPNPPAALHRIWWKQLSIFGSTMGTEERLRGRLRAREERPRRSRSSTRCSRCPRPAPRTSAWRPATSSARSCSRFPASPVPAGLLDERLEEREVLALLRVPEHAEREAVRRVLQRLDRPVLGPGRFAQPLAKAAEALMMRGLDRRAVAEDLAELRFALHR